MGIFTNPIPCPICGKDLRDHYSYGVKYCCNACKQKAYRRRKKEALRRDPAVTLEKDNYICNMPYSKHYKKVCDPHTCAYAQEWYYYDPSKCQYVKIVIEGD